MKFKVFWTIILFIWLSFGLTACTQTSVFEKPAPIIERTPDGMEYYLYRDVSYLPAERTEKIDIYVPIKKSESRDGYPAVLNIHGGGWHEGHKARKITKTCAQAMVDHGYAVFCPDYLLTTDEKKAWPQNIYDCKSALNFIKVAASIYNIDANNIGVLGNSAGGHLAMLTAYSTDNEKLKSGSLYRGNLVKPKCVVNIYGVPDVREFGGPLFIEGSFEEKPVAYELASPIMHLSSDTPPTLTIHGDSDELVPYKLATDLDMLLKLKNISHTLVTVKNGKHAFTLYPDWANNNTDLRPAVIKFLNKHLKK
jgi:acetyl esterase/lipase